MAQGKKATTGKGGVKKVAERAKSAVGAAKKKLAPKKPAVAAKAPAKAPAKAAAKPKPKVSAKPAKPAPKTAAKPAPKAAPKPAAKKPAPKPVAKVARQVAKTKPAVKKVVKAVVKAAPKAVAKVKAAAAAVKTAVAKAAKPAKPAPSAKPAKAAAKVETAKPAKALPKAVPTKPPEKNVAPSTPAVPAPPAPKPAEPEKAKRGRRARPRVTSSGAPAASWLTSEKPRAASFIPAPPRAEAPSAVAAPPASSDRLLRPEDVVDMAVRTVPVRVDVEQGAGRFYIHANPLEIFLRVGEGIEWDFRYLGGADVSCEEVVVEFEKPSPFISTVFRTRKPGGARPHRQMSGPALPTAVGQHIPYMIRANTGFKTELANTKLWLTVTP